MSDDKIQLMDETALWSVQGRRLRVQLKEAQDHVLELARELRGIAWKMHLYGLSSAEIARRLGYSESWVGRMLTQEKRIQAGKPRYSKRQKKKRNKREHIRRS